MKLQLILGWIALVGSLVVIIAIGVGAISSGGISPVMIGKGILMFFVLIWGLYQVTRCRAIKRHEKGGDWGEGFSQK